MTPEEEKEFIAKLKEKMGDDDFVWMLMQIIHNLDDMDKWLGKYNLDTKR